MLHIGETTNKKDMLMRPGLGNNVPARYVQENNYAVSFLTDQTMGDEVTGRNRKSRTREYSRCF